MILTILVIAIGVAMCAGLLKLALWYLNSYRILFRSKCFRGPPAFPIIGNGHLFIGSGADIYEKIQILIKKYPSPFRVWLGPRLFFAVHEPEHIKLILTNPTAVHKDQIYTMFHPFFGDGLLTASVSKWKPHRKIIQPLFNTKVLESYVQVFTSKASIATEKIRMEEGKEFDAYNYLSRYSLDSICETTMGVCVDALNNKDCTYLRMVENILEITTFRLVKPWLYSDFIFNYTPIGRVFHKCINFVREFTEKVLNRAKDEVDKEAEIEPRKSLASLLLSPTEGDYKFTDKEILDEISTIIAAGYETTANLLSYTLLILANYPEIQDKVYAEVCEVFGECGSEILDITLQDLNRMEYLERVLKETLRFFPAAAVIGRRLQNEVTIGEYSLPAGSSIVVDLFQIHRNEKYWSKPLEFEPDRFLPKHPLGPRHPYAYIPFSSGPRNCIGMKYAMMSGKILISTIVSRCIIKSKILQKAKDVKIKMNITLKPKYPIMLYAEKRPIETR